MLNNLQMILENSKVEASTDALPLVNTVLNDAVFRPMLFSTPMVQALLNGTKTQTRREIKNAVRVKRVPQYVEYKDDWNKYMVESSTHEYKLIKPAANIGDIIWVRETHVSNYNADTHIDGYIYKASYNGNEILWTPSLFMKKDACRLWLKVTNVRIERLHNISEIDAINEGVEFDGKGYKNYLMNNFDYQFSCGSYKSLWEKLNGCLSWEGNPWVFVYDFEVTTERPYGFI